MKKMLVAIILLITMNATAQDTKIAPGSVSSGASCNCPKGWGSCSANCFFSDCCICFDPATSEAACGCWLGVGKCDSGPKGVKREATQNSRDFIVYFSFDRFSEFLKYLEEQKIEIRILSEAFSKFYSKYPGSKGKVNVQSEDFIEFTSTYITFTEELEEDHKKLIAEYISSKDK